MHAKMRCPAAEDQKLKPYISLPWLLLPEWLQLACVIDGMTACDNLVFCLSSQLPLCMGLTAATGTKHTQHSRPALSGIVQHALHLQKC